jgi:hypothetical protein
MSLASPQLPRSGCQSLRHPWPKMGEISPPIRQLGSGHWWLLAVARTWEAWKIPGAHTVAINRSVRECIDAVGSRCLASGSIIWRVTAPLCQHIFPDNRRTRPCNRQCPGGEPHTAPHVAEVAPGAVMLPAVEQPCCAGCAARWATGPDRLSDGRSIASGCVNQAITPGLAANMCR